MQMEGMASSEVPSRIRHPGHKHDLTLVPNTPWTIHCDACSHPLSGFHYHCTSSGCCFNLHLCCAGMPFAPSFPYWHQRYPYPDHSFSLLFSPPYENGLFSCDLCGSSGSRWLYKCNTCQNFEVHLGCAIHPQMRPLPQHHMPIVSQPPLPQHHMPNDHWRPGTGNSGMDFSRLGSTMVTALIRVSVGQLLGIGLNAFPLQDVGSSFFSGFSQLFQSVPSAGDFFTSF